MPFHITPSLGPTISINDGLVGELGYWDSGRAVPSPQLGSVVKASDGHDYIYAKASAAIASGAVTVLTEPAMTMATGAGAWTAPTVTGGVPINQHAWFMKTAI